MFEFRDFKFFKFAPLKCADMYNADSRFLLSCSRII